MHGSKKFIVVRTDHPSSRWGPRLAHAASDAARLGLTRIKRSRHRTTVDTYLVRDAEVKWMDRRFGRGSAPKAWRQFLNRRYRARMRHLLRNERFDELHHPPRDAGWYW